MTEKEVQESKERTARKRVEQAEREELKAEQAMRAAATAWRVACKKTVAARDHLLSVRIAGLKLQD